MSIQFRQNNCNIEYSEDNGATWKQVANLNDCVESLISGGDADVLRCSIASYLSDVLKDAQAKTITGYRASLSSSTIAIQILTAIGAIGAIPTFGVGGALVVGAIGAVLTVFGSMSANDIDFYEASLDNAFYKHVTCRLLEILPSGGSIDQRILNLWAEEIRAYNPANQTYNTVAKFVLDNGLDFWVTLARSAVFQRYPGGCVDCNPPPRCQLYTFSGGQRTVLPLQADGSYLVASSPEVGSGYHIAGAGLKYATQCCEIESVEVVGTVTYPAAPVGFATVFSSCRNDSITLIAPQTVEDMEGMCFTGFLLRSPQPFSLRIRTKSCGNTVGSPASFAFALASGSVSEVASSYTTNVVLSLPANTVLTESIIVPVSVVQAATTAESGDFALQTASVTFPAGSANGATQPVTLTINADTDLDNESITLRLGNPTSGALGAITEHTVTIEDDDPRCVSFVMPGNADPYDTGIDIVAGDTMTVVASGSVGYSSSSPRFGPNGEPGGFYSTTQVPSAQGNALIGRIGVGNWFLIGASYSQIINEAGRLYVKANDAIGGNFNNTGSFSIEVCIQ